MTFEEWVQGIRIELERKGLECSNCGGSKYFWISKKTSWQCAKCKSTKSLKGQTVMRNSKLNLYKWFETVSLMKEKEGMISNVQIKKELNFSRYQTAWSVAQRIRLALNVLNNSTHTVISRHPLENLPPMSFRKIKKPPYRKAPFCNEEEGISNQTIVIGVKKVCSSTSQNCYENYFIDNRNLKPLINCDLAYNRRRDILKRMLKFTRVEESPLSLSSAPNIQPLIIKTKTHINVSVEYCKNYLEELNFFIQLRSLAEADRSLQIYKAICSVVWWGWTILISLFCEIQLELSTFRSITSQKCKCESHNSLKCNPNSISNFILCTLNNSFG